MPKTALTDELYSYCLSKGIREHSELVKLRLETQKLANNQMLISPDQGAFMQMIARITNAKSYLEIGVFTGYSALWIALGMPKDGRVTTLDISDEHLKLARTHWKSADVDAKIKPIIAPAINTLKKLINTKDQFDIALIDANKSEYIEYYELCLQVVRPGGLILIDNVLMHGGVLEDNSKKSYIKILQKLNDLLLSDSRVDICMLPIGDGMTIARKKDAR